MIESTTFGKWLKELRLQRDLDLSSLAALSGVDRSTINRIEREVAKPTVCTAVRLCKGLQVGPEELVFALEGRRLPAYLEPLQGHDETVLTAGDMATFIKLARRDPQRARELLTEWLNALSGPYHRSSQHGDNATQPRDSQLIEASQFSQAYIEVLLSDVELVRSEIQYPSRFDGELVLDIYRRGGAITLKDVGAYIRWLRHIQRKSLIETAQPPNMSHSALSRLENGSLEQIRLVDILGLDQKLDTEGEILRMCWVACGLFPEIEKQSAVQKLSYGTTTLWTQREYRLALTLLAIVRWWAYLQPGDPSLVSSIHEELMKPA